MNCPKCGTRVRVLDSKHADSYYSIHYKCEYIDRVQKLVGWYCQDWVYRKRICTSKSCKFRFQTIEVPCEDLDAMFTIKGQVLKKENPTKKLSN